MATRKRKSPPAGRFPADPEAPKRTSAPADARRTGRRRSLDPQGRRALFETPVAAAHDVIRSGPPAEGKAALYSTGPRRAGTVVVTCSSCKAKSRINLTDLGLRWLSGSMWIPGRRNGHWMRCPTCGDRTWCSVGWRD
ncbi:MAG: hypothetical protein ACR2MB_01170 [Acidimicrobiales bacterium]